MDTSHYSAAASILSKLPLGPFSSKSSTVPDVVNDPSPVSASNGTVLTPPTTTLTTDASSKVVSSDPTSASSSEASLILSTAESAAPSPLPSALQTIEGKREREREKRIMPARLQRVSNLLAGSTLEDELSGINAKQEAYILPSQTKFILFSGDQPGFVTSETHIKPQRGSLFATPEFTKSCRARELIETPDFKQRDDTEMMGKTRSIRSEEDTSDAAYERRHRKPDNVEKKQRRLERERLVRDRQKLKERIEQLLVADPRLLTPILNAREQQQKQNEGGEVQSNAATQSQTASPGVVDSASKSTLPFDLSQNMIKLESLRAELLEEANDTMKRYDVLLATPVDSTIALHLGKRKMGDNGVDDGHIETSKPTRSISVSGAFASRGNASKSKIINQGGVNRSASASTTAKEKKPRKRTSQSPLDVKAKRLSAGATVPASPKPFKPEDGPVRAENTYANIHARTSGGRFAPKSALAGTGGSTSKINTKGKWKAEGKPKPPKKVKSPSRATSRSGPISTSGSGNAKIVADATPSSAIDGKPKRVKIILNKRKRASGIDESGSSSADISSLVDSVVVVDKEEDEEAADEMEVDMTPQRAARAALTLEEAQALLDKAMEDDDDDDNEYELSVKREETGNI